MGRWGKRAACTRALQWVSFELDGELSEFERALLQRHLSECAGCAAAARELQTLTLALRASAPLAPRVPLWTPPRSRPTPAWRRLRISLPATLLASLAAAAGAALLLWPSPQPLSAALGKVELQRFVNARALVSEPPPLPRRVVFKPSSFTSHPLA